MPSRSYQRLGNAVHISASLAMLIAAGIVIWTSLGPKKSKAPAATPLPSSPVSLAGGFAKGNTSAPLALVEYSEFQCPYCANFATRTFPDLDANYIAPGTLLFVYRSFPLKAIHRFAMKAAAAADCSSAKGQFWNVHDQIYRDQSQLSDSYLDSLPLLFMIDGPDYQSCLPLGLARTEQSIKEAEGYGIRSTPTFFLGRVLPNNQMKVLNVFSGARSFAEFKSLIDPLLR